MHRLSRLCGIAAGVLILTIWSAAEVWADTPSPATNPGTSDPNAPTTITLQVPANVAAGATTITIDIASSANGQGTEVHIVSNADPRAPAIIQAAVGTAGVSTVPVDTQHPFKWDVPATPAPVGCGPHPPAGTPGCAGAGQAPAQAQPQATTTPVPTSAAASSPVQVAGVQATPASSAPAVTPPVQRPAAEAASASGEAAASVSGPSAAPPQATPPQTAQASTVYTVRPGDTLSGIAVRFYADPAAYVRIAQANAGRVMADGQVFRSPSVLRPGWRLVIPQPQSPQAGAERGGGRSYTVQRGDTLSSIAARFLGSPARWSEVYALNRGSLGPNPNLIRPGTQLRLPAGGSQ